MPETVEMEQYDQANPDCVNRPNSAIMHFESTECYSSESSSAASAEPSEDMSSGSIMLNPPSPVDFDAIVAELYHALLRMKHSMPQAPAPEVACLLISWLQQGSRQGYSPMVHVGYSNAQNGAVAFIFARPFSVPRRGIMGRSLSSFNDGHLLQNVLIHSCPESDTQFKNGYIAVLLIAVGLHKRSLKPWRSPACNSSVVDRTFRRGTYAPLVVRLPKRNRCGGYQCT
uniref:Uncharacterized protein n=1 Tax=Trichuris muris TaxID=70415 RepID=A0A5S6QGY3_TRIMR